MPRAATNWGLASVCWRMIGTQGDRSCPELAAVVLCQNCPIYGRHGRLLLNRPPDPAYREEQTRRWAAPEEVTAPQVGSVVVFRVGREWLALATALVWRVAPEGAIQPLPHRRSPVVLGLVNVEGRLVVCISLHQLLAEEQTPAQRAGQAIFPRLLVFDTGQGLLAAPVDEVAGVVHYAAHQVQPPPAALLATSNQQVVGLLQQGERRAGMLDPQRLINALRLHLT